MESWGNVYLQERKQNSKKNLEFLLCSCILLLSATTISNKVPINQFIQVILYLIVFLSGIFIVKYIFEYDNLSITHKLTYETKRLSVSTDQKSFRNAFDRFIQNLKQLRKLDDKISSRVSFHRIKNPYNSFTGGEYELFQKYNEEYQKLKHQEYLSKLSLLIINSQIQEIDTIPKNKILEVSQQSIEYIINIENMLPILEELCLQYDELSRMKTQLIQAIKLLEQNELISSRELAANLDTDTKITEFLLIGMNKSKLKLGEFDKHTHTFTKKESCEGIIITPKIGDKEVCTVCYAEIENSKCNFCQSQAKICEICKSGFQNFDEITKCENCGFTFHFNHFKESVRIWGTCLSVKNKLVIER